MSSAGELYLKDVRRLPCEICVRFFGVPSDPANTVVSSAHHPRTGAGAARKNPDEDAISLCPEHHQYGPLSLHGMGRKAFERHWGVTEAELTESTRKRVQQLRTMEV